MYPNSQVVCGTRANKHHSCIGLCGWFVFKSHFCLFSFILHVLWSKLLNFHTILRSLHWLKINERIEYELLSLT